MEAEVAKASGSPASWSWARTRETVVVLAAALACFGVLIAGMTFAVQPLDEDLRVLQATMGDVRERLARVGKDIEALKEGQARILALLERRARDSAN